MKEIAFFAIFSTQIHESTEGTKGLRPKQFRDLVKPKSPKQGFDKSCLFFQPSDWLGFAVWMHASW